MGNVKVTSATIQLKDRGAPPWGSVPLDDLYVISGAGFGAKTGTPYYDDFQSEPVGAITGAIGGLSVSNTLGLSIIDSDSNSGTKCVDKDYSNGDFPKIFRSLSGLNDRVYMSCFIKTSGNGGDVWKHGRVGSNAEYNGTPHAGSSYSSTIGSPVPEVFAGEIVTSDGITTTWVQNTSVVSPEVLTPNVWHFYELEFYAGTVDTNDSYFYERIDGQATVVWENRPYLTTANSDLPDWVMTVINGHDGVNTLTMLMDDFYSDESLARVVMTDNAVYANSTKRAVQPIESYTDTQVTTARKRQGFSVGETAYLHLFDNDGVLVDSGSSFLVEEDS